MGEIPCAFKGAWVMRRRRRRKFGDYFGDTTIKIACRAQIRCVGKQQMDPNSTLLKARARALLQVARCAQHSLHRRSGGAQGGGEKIWIREPLLMGKIDSKVGWVAC